MESGTGNSIDGTDEWQNAFEVLQLLNDEYGLIIAPNPFNNITKITFATTSTTRANLSLYNIIGQRVTELFEGQVEANKTYTYTLDATLLSNGIYICQLKTDYGILNK